MRSSQAVAAAVLGTVLCGGWALAATKPGRDNPPPPNRPFFPPANTAADHPRPAAPPRQWSPAAAARDPSRTGEPRDAASHRDRNHGPNSSASPREYLFYFDPYYGFYYPYSYYGYWPSLDAYGLGPAVQDTSRYEGVDRAVQPWPDGGAAADEPRRAGPLERKARAERVNHARQDELAAKHIDYGDTLFAKQKYAEANDCYRQAAHNAPQLATAWFRQGLALAALGHCDSAADKIKRGLKLDPAWPKSNFSLDRLFANNDAAKDACLDAAAAAAKEKPANANRLFLLGVLMHFDGQSERAAKVFARAERAAGNNVGHIEAFLDEER